MQIWHDLHIHTCLSKCCANRELQVPANIVSLAKKKGMRVVGLTDHIWTNKDVECGEWYRGQDETNLEKSREAIKGLASGITVLLGCEADTAAPGVYSITPEIKESVDYVLLSCSHTNLKAAVRQPFGPSPRDAAANLLELFYSGVKSGLADIIPHPFTPSGPRDLHDRVIASISDNEFIDAFGLAASKSIAMELNASSVPLPGDNTFSIETTIRIITLAKRAGCRFTFGSDAHKPESQATIERILPVIEKAGITEKDIMPVDVLFKKK